MKEIIENIDKAQLKWVADWHIQEPESFEDSFIGLVEKQHAQNFWLWHQEDIARETDVTDETIAIVKRKIDKLNQKRNDLIEKLDEYLLSWLHNEGVKINEAAPLNSETPGSMIDRSSIMSLKIYHMSEEAVRESATEEHRKKAADKVKILKEQRGDLLNSLVEILEETKKGTRRFKIYRQFKMYNDPTLNPRLYKK